MGEYEQHVQAIEENNLLHSTPMPKRGRRRVKKRRRDSSVMESVSQDLTGKRRLMFLCFDEFQMNDIGDAVILKGLLNQLFAAGVVVVATGNRAPDKINQSLLGKDDFDDFLDIFSQKCEMVHLHTDDYRERLSQLPAAALQSAEPGRGPASSTSAPFFATSSSYPFSLASPSDSGGSLMTSPFFADVFSAQGMPPGFPYLQGMHDPVATLDGLYESLTTRAEQHPDPEPVAGMDLTDGASIPVLMGRTLFVPRCRGGVAYFDFKALCARPLGAADYIALCHHFHTVVLSEVPQMSQNTRDQARRFITLVDELYNHKIKLVCTAVCEPRDLFAGVDESNAWQETSENLEFEYEGPRDMSLDEDKDKVNAASKRLMSATDAGNNTLVTGEDERFAFDRACSRLMEMRSPHYLYKSVLTGLN